MEKIIKFSSNYSDCWALNANSTGFCWALNTNTIDFCWALESNKNLHLEPNKQHNLS